MDKINSFSEWIQTHWLSVIVLLTFGWCFFLVLIGFSWLIGFWANALYGYKFELNSCVQIIPVVIGGFAGIVGLAKAGWEKYKADSQFNSELGQQVTK